MHTGRRGQINLLVPVAIIALLVSVLMPSLAAARKQARRAVAMTAIMHVLADGKIRDLPTLQKEADRTEQVTLPPDAFDDALQVLLESKSIIWAEGGLRLSYIRATSTAPSE